MTKNKKKIKGYNVTYTEKLITIHKSYKLGYFEIADFCNELKKELPFKYKRSAESWRKEIVSHNLLYDLNIFRDHCIDSDLEENEKRIRLFVYDVLDVIALFYYSWKEGHK